MRCTIYKKTMEAISIAFDYMNLPFERRKTKLHKFYSKFDFNDSRSVFFFLQKVVSIQMQASRLHFGRHDAFSSISNDKIFHSTTEWIFEQFVGVFSTLVCTFEPKLTFDWPILTENVCILEKCVYLVRPKSSNWWNGNPKERRVIRHFQFNIYMHNQYTIHQ